MNESPSFYVPSPEEIQAQLFSNPGAVPPLLPLQWSATALLTPFGGLATVPPLSSSDELIAARLHYESTPSFQTLRTRLYLLESGSYYDFFFITRAGQTSWYWLVSDPADPDPNPATQQAFGPYSTPTQVPLPSFLGDAGFAYAGTWNVVNQSCDGYSGGGSNKEMNAGTWFSFFNGTNTPSRIMNVDNTNDYHIPVLGAYYLVNFTTFEATSSSSQASATALELLKASDTVGAAASPMVTLQDIQAAMANPPSGAPFIPCTAQDISGVIPGLSFPVSQPVPPSWTNQMQTFCYMIGQDTYPYYSQVYYDYTVNQTQISVFVTTDITLGTEPYNSRQDMVLPLGAVGPAVNYQWVSNEVQWGAACYSPQGGVVPMSVPNFVQEAGGRCRAVIENNPYFAANDTISIWSVMLGAGTGTGTGWSDFWYWFNSAQQGIVFSLAPASSLTMIDYQTFVQNPTFPAGTFAEPQSGVPQCPSSAAAQLQKAMFI